MELIKAIIMQAFKVLAHPYTVIITFFLIIISGQHLGGFYLLYLLLSLPFWGIHSLFALSGTAILLVSYHKLKRKKISTIENIMNTCGIFLLMLSLFFFFYNDKQHYNYATFDQLVPRTSLIIFFIIAISFLANNLSKK